MRRLKIEFAEPTQLSAEFERNIAVGGAQIPTRERFELREFVEVEFCFSWRSEMRVFEAEVVFSGAGKVAVQFRKSASELRAELAPFMPQGPSAGAPKRAPRVEDFSLDDEEDAGPSADSVRPAELEAPDPGGKTVARSGREQDPLAAVADRRKSPRATARVPARLQSTHVHL